MPRIAITINDQLLETLDELADLNGQTKSQVIEEYFETCHGSLRSLIELLKLSQDAPTQIRRSMLRSYEHFEKELRKSAGLKAGESLDGLWR